MGFDSLEISYLTHIPPIFYFSLAVPSLLRHVIVAWYIRGNVLCTHVKPESEGKLTPQGHSSTNSEGT